MQLKTISSFILFISSFTPLFSQQDKPKHIVLNWENDPSTTQSVCWQTSSKAEDPIALLMPASHRPYGEEKAIQYQVAIDSVIDSDGSSRYYYQASFTDLTPGTQYLYQVGSLENRKSAWNTFTTAKVNEDDFSFLYLGDIQNDILTWGSRTIREAYASQPHAAFMLFAGDLIDNAHDPNQWDEWFEAVSHVSELMPIVPVSGNHEYEERGPDEDAEVLSVYWRPQFGLPTNGPAGLEESAYYIDYQSMRLIVLNSTAALLSKKMLEKQTDWLEQVLKDNPKKWTIVSFHHPLFSARDGRHGDYPDLRETWKPVFEKHGVDLVIMGHDHVYNRGNLGRSQGPVYVVSVAGPKMYGVLPEKRWMDRNAVDTQLYQVISIKNNTLELSAYTVMHELYDHFSIQKRPQKDNKFTEYISSDDHPENTFPDGSSVRSK